jgi:hypothetical protein
MMASWWLFWIHRAATMSGSSAFNHEAWGWRGDMVWMLFLLGMVWLCAALWWR